MRQMRRVRRNTMEFIRRVRKPSISKWSVDDVFEWLERGDLWGFAEIFRYLQVNGAILLSIKTSDLIDYGLSDPEHVNIFLDLRQKLIK